MQQVTYTTRDIQHSELWEVASRLISIDTVSAHSNMEAVDFIANYAQEAGLHVRVLQDDIEGVKKGSVIAWAGPAVEHGLILSGHTDVVPFAEQPGWRYDPLKMQLDGERIYGRGVSDMKVFLAQALVAAKRQKLDQIDQLKRPLVFLLTYDEEVAGQGSGRLVKQLPEVFKEVPLPTVALIGEPTDFEIFPAHKGYASFDIRVHGKAGHSSVPGAGLNAITTMAEVIRIIQETDHELELRTTPENQDLFPECAYSAFNLGMIHGGLAPNMIAEHCRLTVSLRVTPDDDFQQILAHLRSRFDQEITPAMRTKGADCGVYIENPIMTPPLKSPSESPFTRLLSEVMERPVNKGAPFATDGGQFAALGIQSYICGPGALAEAHQPNESLTIANFLSGQQRLERIIQRWCIAQQP
jgi:acetylornithine deacetylase